MNLLKITALIIALAGTSTALTCPGFPGYCSESFPGQTCVVVCSKGRNNVPLCQQDGTWTDIPRCIEHDPGVEQQIPGLCPGIAGYCSEGYLDRRCTFKCPIGPDIDSVCTQDGTWEPYPTCQGDLRETQDGCNPCPGPDGRFRNRTAENILGIGGQNRPSQALQQPGRVVRPTFAGNQAFGRIPSTAKPFVFQQPSRTASQPSFISKQTTRPTKRPKGQMPSIPRFFIGPDGRIRTTDDRPSTQQRPREQQPSQVFDFSRPKSGVQQPKPLRTPSEQRKILQDVISRFPSGAGGGHRGRRPIPRTTTTTTERPFQPPQSFENFPQPRKLPAPQMKTVKTDNRARQPLPQTPRKIPQTPKIIPQTPRKIPQTPRKIPQTPKRIPQTPRKIPQTPRGPPASPGTNGQPPRIPQTPGVNQPVTERSREPVPVRLFEEDDAAFGIGGNGNDFFGPFQVFDPNDQSSPVGLSPNLRTFPAIPNNEGFRRGPPPTPPPQDDSEFGPFQVVPLKK